ncbi:MAG: exodeoxyribonuclease VII large subunit, partial [Pseudomonadota bacterium]|nr:exodeoxyribonuclease VII large subunit [Pseudomonadota bacterium]
GRLQRATLRQQAWQGERLLALGRRLVAAALTERQQRQQRLAALAQALQLLDPGQVLQRGYSLSYRADGRLLRAPGEVESGERIEVVLAHGRIAARVLAG